MAATDLLAGPRNGFRRTADPDAPVVIRFAALGDVVLLTVLLEALHQR